VITCRHRVDPRPERKPPIGALGGWGSGASALHVLELPDVKRAAGPRVRKAELILNCRASQKNEQWFTLSHGAGGHARRLSIGRERQENRPYNLDNFGVKITVRLAEVAPPRLHYLRGPPSHFPEEGPPYRGSSLNLPFRLGLRRARSAAFSVKCVAIFPRSSQAQYPGRFKLKNYRHH
jgi:hypothetical protein